MAVAVLQLYCHSDSLIHIFHTDDTENRHHQLCPDQGMCLLSLENDAADFVAYSHTDFSEKDFGTASHAFTADDFLAILVIQNGIYQLLDLFGARMITAVLFHVIDQLVCHGIYNDNLLSLRCREGCYQRCSR